MKKDSYQTVTLNNVIDNIYDLYNGHWGPLENGALTNDATPVLQGSAEPGSVVNIYDNAILIGSAQTDPEGNWRYMPEQRLDDGMHSLTVCEVTDSGVSEPTAPFVIQLDTQPTGGIITHITDTQGHDIAAGSMTDDKQPVISGQAEPGSTVHVHVYDQVNNHYWIDATTDINGVWTVEPAGFDLIGVYTFSVTTIDAAGNISSPSDSYQIEYYDPQLVSFSLDAVTDDVNNHYEDFTGALTAYDITDDASPTLSGTANPGLQINIYDNNELLGSVTAAKDGSWSFTPENPLQDGVHNLSISEMTPAGETAQTDLFTFTVDATPPSGNVVFLSDTNGTLLHSDSVTEENAFILSGQAEPGTTVHINAIPPTGGQLSLGEATTDSEGNWQFNTGNLEMIGKWTYIIDVTDEAGNVTHMTERPSVIYYDPALVHVTLDSAIDDVDHGYQDFIGALSENAVTDDSQPTLSGHGNPGFDVNVYDNGELLGSATVDSRGLWSFTPAAPLADGAHSITVAEVTPDGEAGETSPFAFSVATEAPEGQIVQVTDDDGNVIQDGAITTDSTPLISGTATPDSEIHVHVYGPDGHELYWGSATTDEQGNWSYQPQAFDELGSYSFNIAVVDEAGNIGRSDEHISVNYYDESLVSVTLDAVTDNVQHDSLPADTTGPVADNGWINDPQPTINGTANPGLEVRIYDGNEFLGSAVANSQGEWSYQPEQPLSEGEHSLSVTEVTAVGETEPTAAITFSIDTTAPEVALDAITDSAGQVLTDDSITTDPQPVISGTADPGSEVHVHVISPEGQHLYWEPVTVGEDGNWSYQPQAFEQDGSYGIQVTVIDQAGNVFRDPATTTVNYESDSSDANQSSFNELLAGSHSVLPADLTSEGVAHAAAYYDHPAAHETFSGSADSLLAHQDIHPMG
ncbi:MAG: Ig-like domain-containing protein [Scandinavium sp.]|uniref:Ig-like domain-containing protein n=1 Tax=Scandinavium sp. TaxID=2830653 RepID=UPI003F2A5EFE